jgi:hypothetical protein
MPRLTLPLTIGLLTAVALAIGAYFSKDDDSRPSSDSSSRSHGTSPNRTPPSRQPPPSSSNAPDFRAHSKAADRTPVASGNYHSPYYPSHVTPHAGESRQAPPTPVRTQASSTRNYSQATYQRSTDPGPDSSRVFRSPLTHSCRGYPQALTGAGGGSKSTRVAQPSPVPAVLSDPESDELDNLDDLDAAEKLRERAGRLHSKMLEARTLSKSAHSLGDYAAEGKHEREATTYESARDQLNTRAAWIIFKHTNKVCM